MSEKRSGQDRRSGVNHMLFFDRRSGRDRRFKNGSAKRSLKKFNAKIYIEDLYGQFENIIIKKGILKVNNIINEALLLKNPVFYLSGPPQMIQAFERKLLEKSIDSSRIKFDNWE